MSAVIKAENLSKLYHIGRKRSGSFREAISDRISSIFSRKEIEETLFWALSDISFELQQGEVLGVIGKNGAGKSTLLKILSRITEPTEGKVEIEGRVSSLLEVGTGFHPELTGRENVFLNGAILGMKRSEIRSKFDEIVSFSGIEDFIDTPVKHYSSGMYVRLAFAVAAHLEPDILIVDEVLAVGDAEFQKKCLGKMKDVSKLEGRTVLFVSHNMPAINTLCTRGLLLSGGKTVLFGEIPDVCSAYTDLIEQDSANGNSVSASGDQFARFIKAELVNRAGNSSKSFFVNEEVGIRISYEVLSDKANPRLSIYLHGTFGETILCSIDPIDGTSSGVITKTVWLPPDFLNEGNFSVSVASSTFFPHKVHFHERHICSFVAYDRIDSLTRQGFTGTLLGFLRPELKWELNSRVEKQIT